MSDPVPAESLAFLLLRECLGVQQGQLARRLGCRPSVLSEIEGGTKQASPERRKEILDLLELRPETVPWAAAFIEKVRTVGRKRRRPEEADAALLWEIEDLVAEASQSVHDFLLAVVFRFIRRLEVLEARRQAPRLWVRLRRHPHERRLRLVQENKDFQSWALCELLCHESVKAAGHSVAQALELANLALRIAELLPDEELWRQRVQGYVWAHVGNARRVASDLPGAEKAFAQARRLWKAGAAADPGILNEARVLGLEASLRRAQRHPEEALALLEEALAVDQGEEKPYLLLNMANTLHVLGKEEESISVLGRAEPLIDGDREPRQLFGLRFTLVANLCLLGRAEEAEAKLSEVRKQAAQLGQQLCLIRVRWLEAKVFACSGREGQALAAFDEVRRAFSLLEHDYDFALASVEVAELHLKQGRTAEVKVLATEVKGIFERQQVPEEASRAHWLFWDAAREESAQPEMAGRLVRYLYRAQHDPELPFAA